MKGVSLTLPCKVIFTRRLILASSDNIFLALQGTLVTGLYALVVHSSAIEEGDPLESTTLMTHLLEKDREALQPLLLLTVME